MDLLDEKFFLNVKNILFLAIVITLLFSFSIWCFFDDWNNKFSAWGLLVSCVSTLLLFATLTAQIKANKLTREQQSFQYVSEQFNRLEDRYNLVVKETEKIDSDIRSSKLPVYNEFGDDKRSTYIDSNEITYTIILIKELKKAIELKEQDKEMLLTKLKLLYEIKYKSNFSKIKNTISENSDIEIQPKEKVEKLVFEINDLEKILN